MNKFYLFVVFSLVLIGSLVGLGIHDGNADSEGLNLGAFSKESHSESAAAGFDGGKKIDSALNEEEMIRRERKQKFTAAATESRATKIPVLTYHNILAKEDLVEKDYKSNGDLQNTIVLQSEFKKQMLLLHDNNYFTLTLNEFEKYMNEEIDIPEKSVLITFDDGKRNNYIRAYPVLKEFNFHAVEFLITNYNKEKNSVEDHYLSKEEIEAASDVFEFASHTHSFHNVEEEGTAYLVSKTIDEIQQDIETSIDLIGETNALAYPYGAYDEETMEAIKNAGIDIAFTVQPGYAKPGDDMLQLYRNTIRPDHTLTDFEEILTKK